MTAISMLTTMALATPPDVIGADTPSAGKLVAQTYEYDTEGDRVNVQYRPRGWFMYFPRYPIPQDYEPRDRYPETRDNPAQESYLERRDSPQQEEYLERRDDAAQEEYVSPRGDE